MSEKRFIRTKKGQEKIVKTKILLKLLIISAILLTITSCDTSPVPGGTNKTHGEPQNVVKSFLDAWNIKNYEVMSNYCYKSFWKKHSELFRKNQLVKITPYKWMRKVRRGVTTRTVLYLGVQANGPGFRQGKKLKLSMKPENGLWYIYQLDYE